ncbi:MAG: FeoA domain-containing protein [Bacteroidetes bacterium]|nr:FeoA domain-containing protein [Bacteroidota bacterium]
MKTLNELSPGERAFIVDMRNSQLCQKLFSAGIFPGSVVEVQKNDLRADSIVVTINNQTFILLKKAAESILTNSVTFELSMN